MYSFASVFGSERCDNRHWRSRATASGTRCQRRRHQQHQQRLERFREDVAQPCRRERARFRFPGWGKVAQQRGEIHRRRDDFTRHPQSGNHTGLAIRFDADQERRADIGRLWFQPTAVAVDDRGLGTEAAVECRPAPVRQSRKLAQSGIAVDLPRGRMKLAEQLVFRIDWCDRHASRQPGGDTQIGPVPPAVIHDIPRNPRLFPKAIQRDVRPLLDRQPPQRLQQFFPSRHGPLPPASHVMRL